MVEPNNRGGDVALFIDWENFKISLAAGNRSPNLSSLKEEVSNQGRVVVAKAYADWVTRAPELRGASQFFNDPPSLYAAGIEPVFVPTRIPSTQASSANGMRTYRVKNSVDVKMTADCIECAHSYPNIRTFVLVSGDSDFLHVVNALRTMGKHVVIIGVSWSTSRRLADQVDSLLLYDKDVDPLAPQPAVLPQHVARTESQNEVPELPEVIRAIEEIIREERTAGGQPCSPHQAAHDATLPQLRREEAGLLGLQEADGPGRRGRQHQADPLGLGGLGDPGRRGGA